MRQTTVFVWDGEEKTIKELTVEEVVALFDEMGQTTNSLNLMYPNRIPPEAVVKSSGISRKELLDVTPSQLEQLDKLWDAVEKVNPFFDAVVKRLLDLAAAQVAP